MVHTLPDYTTKYKLAKIFGQYDTGELACRLGSLSTEDRRGNVVWFDDFEATTAKWSLGGGGGGGSAALSTTTARYGKQCVKIVTPNAVALFSTMLQYFTLPSNYKIGTEIYILFIDKEIKLTQYFYGYTGTAIFTATLEIDLNAETVKITDDAGVQQTIATTIPWTLNEQPWILVKLVIDWDTKKYIRLIIGNNEYDISAYGLESAMSVHKEGIQVWYIAQCTDNTNNTLYFDDFILTQN
jgi:hypothetical protein